MKHALSNGTGSIHVPDWPHGIEYGDFRCVLQKTARLTCTSLGPRFLTESATKGYCCRIFAGGACGFAFSDSLSRHGMRDVMDEAFALTKQEQSGARQVRTLPVAIKKTSVGAKSNDQESLALEEKVALLAELMSDLKNKARLPSYAEAHYVSDAVEQLVANSAGGNVSWSTIRTYLVLSVSLKGENRIASGTVYCGTTGRADAANTLMESGLGEEAIEIARDQLIAKSFSDGRYKVVLDAQLASVLMHELVGHNLEADNVLRSESIVKGKINQQIASDCLTIYDDPSIVGSFASYPFDDEGVEARKKVLVKNGFLESYLHSIRTAAILGGSPGNARAQNHQVEPLPRVSNLCLEAGAYGKEELCEEVGDGLYLAGAGPVSDTNTCSGEIRLAAQNIHRISSGQMTSPLAPCTLRGNALKLLKSVKAVGKEWNVNTPGFCVKGGQTVPCDGGSPSMTVEDVIIEH